MARVTNFGDPTYEPTDEELAAKGSVVGMPIWEGGNGPRAGAS